MRHRIRAGLIHLSLSASIAALVFLPIYFFWYPDVLYDYAGGRDLFLLIVSVDVTLGPLITTVIFVPGGGVMMMPVLRSSLLRCA